MNDGYQKRLASWVVTEKQRTGLSDAGLADAITQASGIELTRGSILSWRNLKQKLPPKSIQALAAYRKESPEQTEAWLNSDYSPDKDSEEVLEWVQQAPLSEVFAIIQVGMNRIAKEGFPGATAVIDLKSPQKLSTPMQEYFLSNFQRQRISQLFSSSLRKRGLFHSPDIAAEEAGFLRSQYSRSLLIALRDESLNVSFSKQILEVVAVLCFQPVEPWFDGEPRLTNITFRNADELLMYISKGGNGFTSQV